MKTQQLLLLAMLITPLASAQVQLESSYYHSGTVTELSPGEFKYYMMDVPLKECRIYNMDHSIYKTISLAAPEGFYLYDLKFVSRNIFDADEDIELLFIYQKTTMLNSKPIYTYGMKVIDEDGSNLLTLGDGAVGELHLVNNALKLLAYQYIWNDSYYLVYTNVYSLGGTSSAAALLPEQQMRIYPNPVTDKLHLNLENIHPNSVIVSDISGKTVINEKLDRSADHQQLQTEHLSPGTYIMNIVTDEGTIPGTKFIKTR